MIIKDEKSFKEHIRGRTEGRYRMPNFPVFVWHEWENFGIAGDGMYSSWVEIPEGADEESWSSGFDAALNASCHNRVKV